MLEIIEQIASTSKRNEKIEILKGREDSDLLKKIAHATYEPTINYWVVDYDRSDTHDGTLSLAEALNGLKKLSTRQLTGGAAKAFVEEMDSKLSAGDAEVLNRVLAGDLKCGASAGTINKAFPGLIYEHPYMRCSSFSEKNLKKLKYPCYSQTKEDGLYTDIVCDSNKIEFRSRTGGFLQVGSEITDSKFVTGMGYVFQGEAVVFNEDFTDFLSRKEGNGYLNSDDIDASRVCFVLWDMIPVNDWKAGICTIEYKDRLNQLKRFISTCNTRNIQLVDTRTVNNADEIIAHFKELALKGKEGTVVKNFTTIWKDYTSPDQIKVKIVFSVDLKITGIKEGKNKYVGMVGSLECETSDSLLNVNVAGFTDKQRAEYFTKSIIGKIMSVKANDIIQNENTPEKWSLFLPRMEEIRFDKTEADSFERVKEQRDSFINTLKVIM